MSGAGGAGAAAGPAGWDRARVEALLDALERGERRAAVPRPDGSWAADAEVKEGILAAFRLGVDTDLPAPPFAYRDRDTLPPCGALPPGVRVVPGGRRSAGGRTWRRESS